MDKSRFVYVTYIRTTPEKLWQALIDPAFTRRYWVETWQDSTWQPGASWKLMIPDGRIGDQGEIIEIEPRKRLVLSWRNEFKPEMKAEGFSRLTIDLEQQGDTMKLTLVHEIDRKGSKLIEAVSGGWPMILASLKSLLETGESIEATRKWPEGV
ncbi:SRPBCC family protein [Roseiarcaceae bacterium H3SJ34-1]|uniref:SRPBCC family protein n=1 Tax=Terripilifer ovatus TaxID=3032367 RepID=UPI003AB9981E|nr:SRPBCC family protein [Roseiarcaceae bacterium H3SJ34-1]